MCMYVERERERTKKRYMRGIVHVLVISFSAGVRGGLCLEISKSH